MGIDITFTQRKKIVCPRCGEVVGHTDVRTIDGYGRGWYQFLESIGYYVPQDQRTEENDWYGKDMVLTEAQADLLFLFARKNHLCGADELPVMIAAARYEHDDIVINADW